MCAISKGTHKTIQQYCRLFICQQKAIEKEEHTTEKVQKIEATALEKNSENCRRKRRKKAVDR